MKSYLRAVLGREKAFTLIELLIVIAIIAILTIAFLPGAFKAPAKARDAQRQKAVRDIAAAAESYIAEHSSLIPDDVASFCFTSDVVLKGFFTTLPKDPRPKTAVGETACNDPAAQPATPAGDALPGREKYFYRAENAAAVSDSFYVVGAVMEVQGSGNSSIDWTTLSGAGLTKVTVEGTINGPPNATRPYYIYVGPSNI